VGAGEVQAAEVGVRGAGQALVGAGPHAGGTGGVAGQAEVGRDGLHAVLQVVVCALDAGREAGRAALQAALLVQVVPLLADCGKAGSAQPRAPLSPTPRPFPTSPTLTHAGLAGGQGLAAAALQLVGEAGGVGGCPIQHERELGQRACSDRG